MRKDSHAIESRINARKQIKFSTPAPGQPRGGHSEAVPPKFLLFPLNDSNSENLTWS